jgi:hypothetical protein
VHSLYLLRSFGCGQLDFLLISEGGDVKWYKSHLWYGYHCTWVDTEGEEWEYTLPKMRKTSLLKVMWYNGKVRKFTRGNNYFLKGK